MSRDDLSQRIQRATKNVQTGWDDARAANVEARMWRTRRRRKVLRVTALSAAVAALLVVGVRVVLPQLSTSQPSQPPPVASLQIDLLDANTRFENGELIAGRIRAQTPRGSPHHIRAGDVDVELFSARALMERSDSVYVRVDEGEAVVRWPGGESKLRAGAEAWFPPRQAVAPSAPVVAPPAPSAPALPEPAPVPPSRQTSVPVWKRLAEQGDFKEAYKALHEAKAPVRDEPAELLLAADVARLSHHPLEALAPLQQVLARHPDDSRAPLAAFTLGRVLLDELGRPSEADDAFATARKLAPTGPLASDALAREVEARSRGGDVATARTLAEEYLRTYPDGPRARLVKHYGGLGE